MKLDAAEIRSALSAELVIERYGLKVKRRGSQFRAGECPRCHERSRREAIAIDIRSGSWCHHGFECGGDVLELIAACEGLDCRRDFRRIVEIAAEISGIAVESSVERDLRVRAAKERARAEVSAELERMVSAHSTAGAAWDGLARDPDARAVDFLGGRGLDAHLLVGVARFAPHGVVVAIRDADGLPISTATRLYDPGDRPKVLALRGHSTKGTMIDAACDIAHGRQVVLVEGLMDALTARVAWPHAVVLGANGASQLSRIVAGIVGRVRLARTRLVLVPHDDEAGIENMTRAGRVAIAAGLEIGRSLDVLDLEHKDLNDAWRANWRPVPARNTEPQW